jgi:hypothetical protein
MELTQRLPFWQSSAFGMVIALRFKRIKRIKKKNNTAILSYSFHSD